MAATFSFRVQDGEGFRNGERLLLLAERGMWFKARNEAGRTGLVPSNHLAPDDPNRPRAAAVARLVAERATQVEAESTTAEAAAAERARRVATAAEADRKWRSLHEARVGGIDLKPVSAEDEAARAAAEAAVATAAAREAARVAARAVAEMSLSTA